MPIALAFFVHYAYAHPLPLGAGGAAWRSLPSVPVLLTAGTLGATHRISTPPALFLSWPPACLPIPSGICSAAATATRPEAPLPLLASKPPPASPRRKATSPAAAPYAAVREVRPRPLDRRRAHRRPDRHAVRALSSLRSRRLHPLGRGLPPRRPLFRRRRQAQRAPSSILGHFAVAIFVLMVLGLMAQRVWKQRRSCEVRDSASSPPSSRDDRTAAEPGQHPALYRRPRHPLDYLPDPAYSRALRVGPKESPACRDLPRDRDVILYCTCPSEETSAKVALQL